MEAYLFDIRLAILPNRQASIFVASNIVSFDHSNYGTKTVRMAINPLVKMTDNSHSWTNKMPKFKFGPEFSSKFCV